MFLVVITVLIVSDIPLLLTLGANIFAPRVDVPAWQVYANEAWSIMLLLSIIAVWFWSKSGVVSYAVLTAMGPVQQVIHSSPINWASIAGVVLLIVLIVPHWRSMSWSFGLRSKRSPDAT